MDALRNFPVPPELAGRFRTLSHDLQRARVNLATGQLRPEHYEALARVLEGRLKDLEAQMHARVLERARTGRVVAWRGPRGGGNA